MTRRVLIIVIAVVLLIGGYVWYMNWRATKSLGSGDVFSDTTPTPRPVADAPTPASSFPTNVPAKNTTVYPSADGTAPQPPQPTPITQQQPMPAIAAPATDTVAPNPPNGLAYGGTGNYQWYRQGNLTWRVNTSTGAACIMFATDEEWRKPRVYQHGCGSTRGN